MSRRLLLLLAAFTVLALTSLAGIATAASTGIGAQNRAWALQTDGPQFVGPQQTESSCTHPGFSGRSSGIAPGFCVATEDVLPTPEVENSKLQNIVNDLYKGTTNPDAVGNGTTADAVRAEAETGEPTGGVFHTMKAEQYSTALTKLLQSGSLNSSDQLVAQSLLDDLQSALGNRP